MVAKCGSQMRPHRDGLLRDLISARSPRRLSSVTERIPAQAVSRAPSPVPPRPPGAKARSPRATPLPKGAQPGSLWPGARSNPGRLLGEPRPGLSMGLGRAPEGWLFFLPPDPYPNLSEAGPVLEAGSRPDAPLWPKKSKASQHFPRWSLLLRSAQRPVRSRCWSGRPNRRGVAWGMEAWLPCPAASPLWTPCAPS